jgi:fumarate reductase flavoprotein subunit
MAEAAGAALVNMDLLPPYFAGVENPPGSGRTLMISLISGIVPNFKGDIWVSKLGQRFMNEDSPSPDARENALRQVPDAAVFAIFDEAQRKANKPPLFAFDEHLKAGKVVKQARAIGALALEIGVPADALLKTIETYNGYVDAGRDAGFGRTDLVRIQVPPFYAIVASGVVFMTMGGVKTNARLQALRVSGQPIPGLYAAGEVQGAAQWMGNAFMGGAGNGAALVFGRLAAKDAVKASRE